MVKYYAKIIYNGVIGAFPGFPQLHAVKTDAVRKKCLPGFRGKAPLDPSYLSASDANSTMTSSAAERYPNNVWSREMSKNPGEK
jgi:hypothetical protein